MAKRDWILAATAATAGALATAVWRARKSPQPGEAATTEDPPAASVVPEHPVAHVAADDDPPRHDRDRLREIKNAARGVVILVFLVLTFELAAPLLQRPADVVDVRREELAIVVEPDGSDTISQTGLELPESTVFTRGGTSGSQHEVWLPGYRNVWIYDSAQAAGFNCTLAGNRAANSAPLPEWMRRFQHGDPASLAHWNAGQEETAHVRCLSLAPVWGDGGANTSVGTLPDVRVVLLKAPAADVGICSAPAAKQTVNMPLANAWRASTADPEFTIGERQVKRDAPCQILDRTDDAFAVFWPGATFSTTDQQAQADLVPRGLLAGAALGVAAQLVIEFAVGSIDGLVRSADRGARAVLATVGRLVRRTPRPKSP